MGRGANLLMIDTAYPKKRLLGRGPEPGETPLTVGGGGGVRVWPNVDVLSTAKVSLQLLRRRWTHVHIGAAT